MTTTSMGIWSTKCMAIIFKLECVVVSIILSEIPVSYPSQMELCYWEMMAN